MPFEVHGEQPLTERIGVRVTPEEKAKLQEDAGLAALSVSELVRRRYFGRAIVASVDMAVIRELRRLGGLVKHLHNESQGAYSQETSQALHQVTSYIASLNRDHQKGSC